MSKESFKLFAKNHPELAEKVLKDNENVVLDYKTFSIIFQLFFQPLFYHLSPAFIKV